jgi:hypothetical protein
MRKNNLTHAGRRDYNKCSYYIHIINPMIYHIYSIYTLVTETKFSAQQKKEEKKRDHKL